MKRKWLVIIAASVIVVAVAAGGTWWWAAANQSNTSASSSAEMGTVAFGAEDLDGFLLTVEDWQPLVGATLENYEPSAVFRGGNITSLTPPECKDVHDVVAGEPAGYRWVSGNVNITSGGFWDINQRVVQFSTPSDAAARFAYMVEQASLCSSYSINTEGSEGTVDVTSLPLDSLGDGDYLGGLDTWTGDLSQVGFATSSQGWFVVRYANVIVTSEFGKFDAGDADVSADDVSSIVKLIDQHALKLAKLRAGSAPTSAPFATPDATNSPPNTWLINFTSIGPVTTSMTAQQAVDILGTGVPIASQIGRDDCSGYDLGEESREEIDLSGLATSQGARGPLDTISVGVFSDFQSPNKEFPLPGYMTAVPQTAEGITFGSTLAELKTAFPGQLKIQASPHLPGAFDVRREGPNNTGMSFFVDNFDSVNSIVVGNMPMVNWGEGCE